MGRKRWEGSQEGHPYSRCTPRAGCPEHYTALGRHSPLARNAEIFILVSFIVFGNSVLVYKT